MYKLYKSQALTYNAELIFSNLRVKENVKFIKMFHCEEFNLYFFTCSFKN